MKNYHIVYSRPDIIIPSGRNFEAKDMAQALFTFSALYPKYTPIVCYETDDHGRINSNHTMPEELITTKEKTHENTI